MICLALIGFTVSSLATDKTELDNQIQTLLGKLEAMQQKPDKRVPFKNLRNAQGVILLNRTKAGFIFAYQGGGGVAMVKDPKTKHWGPVAFVSANEASLGFQVGGEQSFFVILLMNTNATRLLTEPNFQFSGEARGTAGDTSAGEEGKVNPEPAVLVYGDRQGLYGGAAIKGGAITPDDKANRAYYDEFVTMRDVLFGKKVKPTDGAKALAKKLDEYSKKPKE